eukprot:jgi/Botrbrau1/5543/Bobra.0023s0027.2
MEPPCRSEGPGINKGNQKLLEALAPGVFLASSAYSNTQGFQAQLYPAVKKSVMLTVETPGIYNDTQVHVALVEEWDPTFQAGGKPAKLNPSSETNGSIRAVYPAQEPSFNIVFAFRGTEPWNVCDWLSDVNYLTRTIDWWTVPNGKELPKAHQGFLYGAESVTEVYKFCLNGSKKKGYNRTRICNNTEGRTLDWALQQVIKDFKESPEGARFSSLTPAKLTRIVVVGHSLGAAIATIVAVWSRKKLPEYIPELEGKPVTCINTGSPRVGDKNFAAEFNKLMEDKEHFCLYRLMNNCDIVPSVPFASWGFVHVGHPIWLCRKRGAWAFSYFTMTDPDIERDLTGRPCEEKNSRPLGYTCAIADHFEWHYNTAVSQAATTALTPTREEFQRLEAPFMVMVRAFLGSPSVRGFSTYVLNPVLKYLVSAGSYFLMGVQILVHLFPPVVGLVYRYVVNLLFFFFTVPMWGLTHFVYFVES